MGPYDDDGLMLPPTISSLRHLQHLSAGPFLSLPESVSSLSALTSFSSYYYQFKGLKAVLSRLPSLRRLELRKEYPPYPLCLSELGRCLTSLTELHFLLSESGPSPAGAVRLPELVKLSVHGGTGLLRALSPSSLRKLRELDVRGLASDEGVRELVCSAHLEHLTLWGGETPCLMDAALWRDLLWASLTHLSFQKAVLVCIPPEVAQAKPRLRVLDLSNNKFLHVTEECLEALLELGGAGGTLRSLSICRDTGSFVCSQPWPAESWKRIKRFDLACPGCLRCVHKHGFEGYVKGG